MAAQAIVNRALTSAVLLALLLAGMRFWELESQVWGKDLAGHPDETPHFTTGVMMLDYLRSPGEWARPVEFAKNYYAHYPKVAIGHWPPFFYVAQAGWFAVFGTSVGAARVLVLLILGTALALLWRWMLLDFDWRLAALGVAGLLVMPVVQASNVYLLADGLVMLLCLVAMMAWARWLEGRDSVSLVCFCGATVAAILTKGNAWVLLPAAFFTPALALRLEPYRRWRFWIVLGITAALAAPFYLYAKSAQATYPLGNIARALEPAVLTSRFGNLMELLLVVPGGAWVLVVIGLLGLGFGDRSGCPQFRGAGAVGFVGALVVFLGVSGLSYEGRVFLPALPFLVVLAAHGAMRTAAQPLIVRVVVLVLFLAGCFWTRGEFKPAVRDGYRELTRQIPAQEMPVAVLVASDSIGEGAVIVERLLEDLARRNAVLRSTKFLVEQDSNGRHYREIYAEDGQLLDALRRVPTRYVVIDDWSERPHTIRLRRVAEQNFQRIGGVTIEGKKVDLYEDREATNRGIENLRFSLGPWRGNRVIEYRP